MDKKTLAVIVCKKDLQDLLDFCEADLNSLEHDAPGDIEAEKEYEHFIGVHERLTKDLGERI